MMGSTHAVTGMAAGAILASAVGGDAITVGIAGLVCAGSALVPDLDHTNSCATLAHGPITKAISSDLRDLSELCWRKTSTKYDRMSAEHGHDRCGTHRYLTHTALFAVSLGIFVAVAGAFPPVRMLITGLLISFALRGYFQMFPNRKLDHWGARSLIALPLAIFLPIGNVGLGIMTTVGCLVHLLGDWFTKAGIPIFWPVKIRGMYWRRFKFVLTISTGKSKIENVLRWVSLVAGPIAALLLR